MFQSAPTSSGVFLSGRWMNTSLFSISWWARQSGITHARVEKGIRKILTGNVLTCLLMVDPGDLFPGTSLAEGSRPGAQFSELFQGMETPNNQSRTQTPCSRIASYMVSGAKSAPLGH
jgi:hypothetical protein